MATKSALLGLLLLGGVTPYRRIKNKEAARLTAVFAPLREMLVRAKIAWNDEERLKRAVQSSHWSRKLRTEQQINEETKPFRWS